MTKQQSKGKRRVAENPWALAKRLCRLSARHIEMAKALGMNPKKLPGLIPSKTQQWKAPVRVFVEDLYVERFGFDAPLVAKSLVAKSAVTKSTVAGSTVARSAPSRQARRRDTSASSDHSPNQATNTGYCRTSEVLIALVCHLQNLVDDFERVAAAGIEHDLRRQIADHLRALADDVDAGHVSEVPMVDFGVPCDDFDDEVPF